MRPGFAVPDRQTFSTLAAFEAFAAAFGSALEAGDVVALGGELGCGKTTFVRAAVRGRTGEDPASSPTFTFWQRYPGTPPIDHLDLYRIDDPRELREMGLDEAFAGESIVFVEWWTHAPELLPAARLELTIDGAGNGARTVTIERRP